MTDREANFAHFPFGNQQNANLRLFRCMLHRPYVYSFPLYNININMYSAQYGGRSGRAKGKTPKGDKCPICQKKGHVEDSCPKREDTKFKIKAKTGAGSGFSHKTSRKAGSDEKQKNKNDQQDGNGNETALTPVFEIQEVDAQNSPFFFFDAGCDVGESIDSLAILQGSSKRAMSKYQAGLDSSKELYGGCICRQLLKPGRPWNADAVRTKMMLEADPRTFFVVGLGPGFLMNKSADDMDDDDASDADDDDDDDLEEAVDALMEAVDEDERVVGFYAKLEYVPEVLEFPGFDRETQLRRFRATCTAAIQSNVPVQCRVLPGAADKEYDVETHKLVMKDLAKILVEMTPASEESSNNSSLKVHLVCWNGTSENLMKILKAFPDTVYVGMNAAVGFAKASVAHECAFDVPLDRLLLETDSPNTIPATVVASMGRKAYCHSGHVPIVAAAIAEQKKNSGYTAMDVAQMASNNTVALYGRGIAERQQEAAVEAAVRAEALAAQQLIDDGEEGEPKSTSTGQNDDQEENELAAQQLLEEMAAMAVER
jgi:Tat protein secretion system quality control protein TatD with DNase activity